MPMPGSAGFVATGGDPVVIELQMVRAELAKTNTRLAQMQDQDRELQTKSNIETKNTARVLTGWNEVGLPAERTS